MNKKSAQPDITLLFFSFAFFIVLLGLFSKFSFQAPTVNQISQLATQSAPTVTTQKLTTKADFSRTVVCKYSEALASASAVVQDTNIFAQLGKNTFLLTGDCFYRWELGQKAGEKICGVGQYVSIGKNLLGSGLLTGNSAGDVMKKIGGGAALSSFDVQKLLDTCKNTEKVKESIFAIPKGITFR